MFHFFLLLFLLPFVVNKDVHKTAGTALAAGEVGFGCVACNVACSL